MGGREQTIPRPVQQSLPAISCSLRVPTTLLGKHPGHNDLRIHRSQVAVLLSDRGSVLVTMGCACANRFLAKSSNCRFDI